VVVEDNTKEEGEMDLGSLINNNVGHNVPGVVGAIGSIRGVLDAIMIGLIALVGIAAIVYAIWLVIKLGKAEDDGKRKEAKNQLVWAIIGVIGAVLVLILLTTVFNGIRLTNMTNPPAGGNAAAWGVVNRTIGVVITAVNSLLGLIPIIAAVFAIYLAVKFVTATDETKRKQAKQMLIWTCVGVIAAVMLVAVIDIILAEVLRQVR